MPFDWKSFLDVAELLEKTAAGHAHSEALLRSAVGRAYYAAFGHARNYATDFLKFEPREDADDHGRLRNHLKGKRRKGDADRLEQLRQWRNDADYVNELPWTDVPAVAASALAVAKAVFASLVPPTTGT
jgi:hypothetical protein